MPLIPIALAVLFVGASSPPAPRQISGPEYPRLVADPGEPRFSISYAPADPFIDAVMGAPIPLAVSNRKRFPFRLVLEGAAWLRLGRDGSFFPLQTVDGLFGLGLETREGNWRGRVRLNHLSAHKADGDSTVAFRDQTFSREFFAFDVGYREDRLLLYGRLGGSWHAVPRDRGIDVAAGAQWTPPGKKPGFVAAVHLAADTERNWRVTQSAAVGWRFRGASGFQWSAHAFRGHSPRGQYWNLVERYLSIRLQFLMP